ncbi:hypothetical protein EVAR_40691_1 [Eumeta japonica]|uniref:Uncharacterized protein n=1 Tax=Eumeta variegata TaxID=151549 RepID=A0A4C1X671_EUMVA|nr:hypothetical protein EVAR_40691_1 [Eumeta japonica]
MFLFSTTTLHNNGYTCTKQKQSHSSGAFVYDKEAFLFRAPPAPRPPLARDADVNCVASPLQKPVAWKRKLLRSRNFRTSEYLRSGLDTESPAAPFRRRSYTRRAFVGTSLIRSRRGNDPERS